MTLPHASLAVIEPSKVRGYLLSAAHPVGRFRAAVFVALGYSGERWELLRDDLLAIAYTGTAVPGQPSQFGQKFHVDGILVGPSGRAASFRTVWIVKAENEAPRFVTAFPR